MIEINTDGRVELFRAITGSQNYNLNNENSDEDWKVFVLPSFKDLYKGVLYAPPSIISNSTDVSIKDIRVLPNGIYKSNISFLEVLYSKEIVINPNLDEHTKRLINDIFVMRHELVTSNLSRMYLSTKGIFFKYFKEIEKNINEDCGYNTKKAMNSLRVLNFLYKFNKTNDFEQSIRYSDSDRDKKLLMSIKNGEKGSKEEIEKIILGCKDIVDRSCSKDYSKNTINNEVINKIEEIIKEIVLANIKLGVIK